MEERSVMHGFEQWLEQYVNFEKTPKKDALWLDTMRFLCTQFGEPQQAYRSIHTAGSKGKGSVCALCASVLQEAGFKTGLYTSPHVSDIRERVGTAHGFLNESEYKKSVQTFIPAIDFITAKKLTAKKQPTWFELMTLFSFVCFKNCAMDWGVFETGMGGRLDSTNVILPDVCAITLLELEHTEFLGNTLQKIAEEKAGIIKSGVPVCIARQKPEAKRVLQDTAQRMHAGAVFLDDIIEKIDCTVHKGDTPVYSGYAQHVRIAFKQNSGEKQFPPFSRPLSFSLKLAGNFQGENAALAALVLKTALPDLTEDIMERGFEKAFLPARFEIMHTRVGNKVLTIVIDGCHTENSIAGTLDTFFKRFSRGAHLLFACAADKNAETFARIIGASPCAFTRVTVTIPGALKASNYKKTRENFAAVFTPAVLQGSEDFEKEIQQAAQSAADENKVLLAAGSFYLAAEVKKLFKPAVF